MQGLHEVQQVFGLAAADVIDFIWRDGQTVLPHPLFRGFGHHSNNAFHDVIHVGKVAAAVAVVVNLYSLTLQEFVGETEIGHVGTAGRTINRKESQPSCRNIVEFGVAVGEEFVALLSGRIQAHGVVHAVVHTEGDFLVATVNAATTGINQMLHGITAAGLQDVVEAHDVALDVGVRVLDAVAHSRLGREIHHDVEMVFGKKTVDEVAIGDGALYKCPAIGFWLLAFCFLLFAVSDLIGTL